MNTNKDEIRQAALQILRGTGMTDEEIKEALSAKADQEKMIDETALLSLEEQEEVHRLERTAKWINAIGTSALSRGLWLLSTPDIRRLYCNMFDPVLSTSVFDDLKSAESNAWRRIMQDMKAVGWIDSATMEHTTISWLTMKYWIDAKACEEDDGFRRLAQEIRATAIRKEKLPARWGPWDFLPKAHRSAAKFEQIPANEPVFILRAQDRLAADIVREWANRAAACDVNDAKVAGALEDAAAMDAWPTKKMPD